MTPVVVGQLLNGVIVGALYGIVALGVTLTFGITGVVNFALGAFMVLGAYFTWYSHEVLEIAFLPAALLAVIGVSALGYLVDICLFRFTRNHLVNGLLISIGLISIVEASVLLTWSATPKNLSYVLPGVVRFAGITVSKIKLVVGVVLVLTIAATYLGLTKTWFGRAAFAYAQKSGSGDADGGRYGAIGEVCIRLFHRTCGVGWRALRQYLFHRTFAGQRLHPKGSRGGDSRGSGPGHGILGWRGDPGHQRKRRLDISSRRVARCLRSDLSGLRHASEARWAFRRREMKFALIAIGLAALAPVMIQSDAVFTICVYAFLMGALAVSFNFVFGLAGQLSLFHAAAFGLSAYVSVILVTRLHWSFWATVVPAVLAVALVSSCVAALCFRFKLREFYFAVVTMALSEILRLGIQNWYDLTNGTLGIAFIEKPYVWTPGGWLALNNSSEWYFASLTLLTAVCVVCWRIQHSWIGRAFSAIRLNEQLAATMGIDVFAYKFFNFVLGSVLAGLVGAFYAFYTGFVEPHYLSVTQSLNIVAMVLLGGVNTVAGPILGAFILTSLPHLIAIGAELRVILYGAILIFVILAMPKGLWGTIVRGTRHAP